jgi:hypothetical protein
MMPARALLRRALSSAPPGGGRPLAPSAANTYLLEHVRLLNGSLLRLTGRSFLPPDACAEDARRLAANPELVVVSHGVDSPEPIFNYATRAGLELWEIDWDAFVRLPSSRSAEQVERTERQKLLDEVRALTLTLTLTLTQLGTRAVCCEWTRATPRCVGWLAGAYLGFWSG